MTSDERWRRISHLYHQAASLAPDDREAFLRRACGPDDSLRAEVESLLVDDSQWGRWLERHGPRGPQDSQPDHAPPFIGMYEVRSRLGAGAMGEVYRAHDPKLGRDVAIKVLPAAFTADAERLKRFEREARLLAAVNHPNIGAIYGLENANGGHALVLELVEGPTLADRLQTGPIPMREAFGIAQQVATGLGAAHARGIVHRDLKPDNIKISTAGLVKILDFGLAKHDAGAGADLASASHSAFDTRHGVLVGTAAYMSPEQTRGGMVDKRSDNWAFGCVLYQMLTGRVPFAGATVADTLAAVLEREPDWNALPAAVPRSIRQLLRRCLDKEPETRQRDMHSVRVELERAASSRTRARTRIAAALAVVTVAGFPGTWLLHQNNEARRMESLIAEATRFADRDDYTSALSRSTEAASISPDDARVESLLTRVSVIRPIRTDPSGAEVYIKPYNDSGETWRRLGQTPIAQVRLPRGVSRWRIQKAGYQSLEFIAENHRIPARGETPNMSVASAISEQSTQLQPIDAQTPMVPVPVSRLSLQQNLPHYDSPSFPAATFLIGKYEVTNVEFKRFVDAGGYRKPEFWDVAFVKGGKTVSWETAMAEFHDRTGRPGPAAWEVGTYAAGHGQFPVSGVSWYEAAAYAKFAGASLPTVYHWVRAAGVRIAAYITPFSNISANALTVAGARPGVSPFGAFDMAGNVREWGWNETSAGTRYVLGGAWTDPAHSFQEPEARSPFDRSEQIGFRIARYLDSKPLHEGLTGPIPSPALDYAKEQPVSEDVFRAYERVFAIDPAPLDPRVESIDSRHADWSKEKISFTASYDGERVPAFLFLPRNVRPPYQTVVYFPGADAVISKTSDALEIEMFDFLMRSGRAVLFPVYKGTYERQPDLGATRMPPAGGRMSRSYVNRVVRYNTDLRRAVEYLQTRSDIQQTGFGYYGFSWGGSHASIALALEPRFKTALLLSGGFQPYKESPEVSPLNYAPRARVPVLMLNGDNDSTFPVDAQRRLFTLLGTPAEHKRHVLYSGGHGVFGVRRSEMIREMLDWLDRYLGPVTR